MKKLPFYIVLGVATAAIVALVYSLFKSGKISLTLGGNKDAASPAPTLKGYNDTLNKMQLLSADSKNSTNEIIVLQNILNAANPGIVTVNGIFDAQTAAAVKALTGKDSTNIYEVLYIHLAPYLTTNQANELLQNS